MSPRARIPKLTPKEAVALQRELAGRVVRTAASLRVETVAGVDISVKYDQARAAVALSSFPDLKPLAQATAVLPLDFPYVPGLLAFREVPAMLAAFDSLGERPDLVLVDGHGYAHPRRFGSACYLGLELDLPTIGCGKSLLVGEYREPGPRRGARTRLLKDGEVIGTVLRTRAAVKPIFVSIGHRIDLATAVRYVLRCAPRYRLPEPIRAADRIAGELPRKA